MLLIKGTEDGKLAMHDSILSTRAQTGRWCSPPQYPDRCYCFDAKTLTHKVATHYIERRDKEGRYREGACPTCFQERILNGFVRLNAKLRPLPEVQS